MTTDAIYGGWNSLPLTGKQDQLADLWRMLASQNEGNQNFTPNFGLSQRRAEIVPLWELYLRARPQVVLEIGVAQGGTFASWCILGQDSATIIGLDRDLNDARPRPHEPVHQSIYNGELRMSEHGGGIYSLGRRGQKIRGINGWSHEPQTLSQLKEILDGEYIEFLFHDASHSAEMFATDFQLYWPLMVDGGIFAVHDIAPSCDPKCNKSEEWERIKREEKYSALYEFKPHPSVTEMGIGVLIR